MKREPLPFEDVMVAFVSGFQIQLENEFYFLDVFTKVLQKQSETINKAAAEQNERLIRMGPKKQKLILFSQDALIFSIGK